MRKVSRRPGIFRIFLPGADGRWRTRFCFYRETYRFCVSSVDNRMSCLIMVMGRCRRMIIKFCAPCDMTRKRHCNCYAIQLRKKYKECGVVYSILLNQIHCKREKCFCQKYEVTLLSHLYGIFTRICKFQDSTQDLTFLVKFTFLDLLKGVMGPQKT